ncbi:DUF222 domain-containing protein [Arthrobacter sp. ISL-72]|nr:DUF222 domain-containing protein [Arthrobacter sp. ISL-72]
MRRLRECLHPESLTARKASAHRERGVWFSPERDGMCTLTALLAAEVGMAIYNGLDRGARQASARAGGLRAVPGPRTAPDPRTLSELRADALAHRLLGSADESEAGAFHAEVVVTAASRSSLLRRRVCSAATEDPRPCPCRLFAQPKSSRRAAPS